MIEVLSDRSVLQVAGGDSQKFLQGMLTNDVINNIYSYNYLLNNQGRYLFDLFVYKNSSTSYLIDISKDRSDEFIQRLNLYKLRSDIEIRDLSDQYGILYSREEPNYDFEYSAKDPRCHKLGYRSLIKSKDISELKGIADNLYLDDKYNNAIIDGDIDLIYERSILPEYGAEELHAIDYDKGCYVGQEFISRIKHQGVLRKKIFKLQFLANVAGSLSGHDVEDKEGNKIGLVCSNYKNLAIALLREEKFLVLGNQKAIVDGKIVEITIPSWRSN